MSDTNYVIKNIQFVEDKIIEHEATMNKNILVSFFDYFDKLDLYNPDNVCCTLDLDLNFDAFELCYNFISEEIPIILDMVGYTTIIGILEIFDVLFCKNLTFVDKFVSSLITKLDNDSDPTVVIFCRDFLWVNDKINKELKIYISFRMAYVHDPSIYASLIKDTDENILDKITLVVLPKSKWRIFKSTCYPINIDKSSTGFRIKKEYCNWGAMYISSNGTIGNRVELNTDFNEISVKSIVSFDISSSETMNSDCNENMVSNNSMLSINIGDNEDHKWEMIIGGIGSPDDSKILGKCTNFIRFHRFRIIGQNSNGRLEMRNMLLQLPCKYFTNNNLHIVTIVTKRVN